MREEYRARLRHAPMTGTTSRHASKNGAASSSPSAPLHAGSCCNTALNTDAASPVGSPISRQTRAAAAPGGLRCAQLVPARTRRSKPKPQGACTALKRGAATRRWRQPRGRGWPPKKAPSTLRVVLHCAAAMASAAVALRAPAARNVAPAPLRRVQLRAAAPAALSRAAFARPLVRAYTFSSFCSRRGASLGWH